MLQPRNTGTMQRQDDFQIDRSNILLFIVQLVSLADFIIRIGAAGRPVDNRLLHSFVRSEYAMLIVLGGILGNPDTRGLTPGLDDKILFDEPDDRHAELLRIGATFQQIATTLAMVLSMFPRAFRDRARNCVPPFGRRSIAVALRCTPQTDAGTDAGRSQSAARAPP